MENPNEQVTKKVTSASLADFRKIGEQMENRDRKYNDIIKISRDITWESKKIISFLLGNVNDPKNLKKASVTIEAMLKSAKHFNGLACMLNGENQHYFAKAFSLGVQEFVQALILYTYLTKKTLVSYEETLNVLKFKVLDLKINKSEAFNINNEKSQGEQEPIKSPELVELQIRVSREEFILGLSGIPGELLRACAAGVYNNNFKQFLFDSCSFVRILFSRLTCISPYSRAFHAKLRTMKSSLIQLEHACYGTVMNRHLRSMCLILSSKQKETEFDDNENSGYD